MLLESMTLTNYRSITRARKIGLAKNTILIGPNNEGKSNILRALAVGMEILSAVPDMGRHIRVGRQSYDWERDFPIPLQSTKPNGKSVILLEFSLTQAEVSAFQDVIKSKLNGTLPIKISLGASQRPEIKVAKPGRGAKALSSKSGEISRFVAERLSFDYIPAVRTADSARRIVADLVAKELRVLDSDPKYQEALSKLAELQQPYLEKISQSVKETLIKFLPDLKDVSLRPARVPLYRSARNAYEIVIDDGTPTELQHKGDGVQSLAALGIMRHASESRSSSENLFVALEEPESHLHPKAIHALREVIEEMSSRHQVILTTHCPLFVNRRSIASNILVRGNSATPAKSITQIREILGVRASDNLRHAEVVLMVEGASDERIIRALFCHQSTSLAASLKDGFLAFENLSGSGNLSYKASLVRNALCDVHVLLDDDQAGHEAFDKAEAAGVISLADVHFTTCLGMSQAEVEDLINPALYSTAIKDTFGVTLSGPGFKSKKKWSDRMAAVFKAQGKKWDKKVGDRAKELVASAVCEDPMAALNPHKRSSFDSLRASVEERVAGKDPT